MKIFRQKSNEKELNITPLIDIIFILLVFFMVSSSFLKPTIDVKLPVTSTKDSKKNKKISIYITKNLEIYFEKEQKALDLIQSDLTKELTQDLNLTILLYADKNVSFENVVKVFDAVKLSGVKNVAIAHS